MDYKVTIGRIAQKDLADIHRYIARDNPIAADDFIQKLSEAAKSLKTLPRRGGQFNEKPGARFAVAGPYLIIYRIVEAQSEV